MQQSLCSVDKYRNNSDNNNNNNNNNDNGDNGSIRGDQYNHLLLLLHCLFRNALSFWIWLIAWWWLLLLELSGCVGRARDRGRGRDRGGIA
jgi:hypothetical protein